jgi:outer membrane protein assembly factor BamE (lipoprotein component of BamABCDE complex)
MKHVLICLAAILITACATVGREISQDQLANFKKGETTVEQVVAKLGPPTSSSISGTGLRTISYMFAHAQARPGSFVPFIGPLIGGTDSRSSMVILIFGSDGKLQNYHASQSQLGSGTGFAAGAYQQPNVDQPQEAAPKGYVSQ